jgi:hypothetical protein
MAPGEREACSSARRVGAASAAALALLAGVFSTADPAHAQYRKTDPPKTRFRLGPLRFAPRLELRNAGRDDNVFLDPTNPVTDTSVVLRGSVEGFVPVGRRLRLSGEGWLDWSYFRRYSTERSTDPGAEGRAELDVGPFTLVGGGGGLQARQLYSIDIDQRTLREEKWVFAGAEWRISRRFMLSGGADRRSFRYDSSSRTSGGSPTTAAALNRNSLTGRLETRYRLTSMTTAVASADVIEDEFAVSGPGVRKTRSFRYLGGLEFGEKALVTGRVFAGVRDFPAASSGSLPSYRGPAFLAEVSMPVRQRARLLGTLQRDVFVSATPARTEVERARNTYVLFAMTGSAELGLPLGFLGRATVGFTEAEYLLPTIVSGVSFPRVDHLYSAGGSLLKRVSESFRLGGTATYYRRVSTIPGQSYERWVYGVSAELAP